MTENKQGHKLYNDFVTLEGEDVELMGVCCARCQAAIRPAPDTVQEVMDYFNGLACVPVNGGYRD